MKIHKKGFSEKKNSSTQLLWSHREDLVLHIISKRLGNMVCYDSEQSEAKMVNLFKNV